MARPLRVSFVAGCALALAAAWTAAAADSLGVSLPAPPEAADTLRLALPPPSDSTQPVPSGRLVSELDPEDHWLRPPFGDQLLSDIDQWRSAGSREVRWRPRFDYNRVDPLRAGAGVEWMPRRAFVPRAGARFEYAFGRGRGLYGVEVEQPLDAGRRLTFGVSAVRATDHSELQQVENIENSMTLLFGRSDNRDYFEREGAGVYLSWRVPDFSTVSLHLRRDDYRSLSRHPDARSIFFQDRPLRDNPEVNEGRAQTLTLRLERLAHRTRRTRAGLYHWIEIERAGGGLGGDFDYARALGDVRSVLRLSPTSTLVLRGVAGHGLTGTLPFQKEFTVGGVDGLRAHSFAQYRGDQMVLGQAEYVVGLWRMQHSGYVSGLHVLGFLDLGRAWSDPEHRFEPWRQPLQADGGFGIGASEDGLRITCARNLQRERADFVISARLQRPF
jgi:hypothetical protein